MPRPKLWLRRLRKRPKIQPLLRLPNVTLSPHIAAATAAAHVNMSWVVKDIWRVLRGEKPMHPAP